MANGPDGGGVNLAFTASVPPGSTFKMVTALAVMNEGKANVNTVVPCPKGYTVNGRTFTNAGGFELGNVPLHVDFAKSCNTAFAYLGNQLSPTGSAEPAAQLGIGTTWTLGTDCFTGSVQANAAPVDAAAAAFGQGRTLVSPLALAGATAAVARGSWKQPVLFSADARRRAGAAGPGRRQARAGRRHRHRRHRYRVAARDDARGRHRRHRDRPRRRPRRSGHGQDRHGRVRQQPGPHPHLDVGWQGDIAFAVFVENGGSNGGRAPPP